MLTSECVRVMDEVNLFTFVCNSHVDRFPPEVKDLLASDSRKQSLRDSSQVAV